MDEYEKHVICDILYMLDDALEYWQKNMPTSDWSNEISSRLVVLMQDLYKKKGKN